MGTDDIVRVAAVADVHCGRRGQGTLRPLFEQMAATADVLLICGDLTNHGHPDEARVLAGELAAIQGVPVIAVLGNHDHEGGLLDQLGAALSEAGIILLDGTACTVRGVGFAGTKGFGGGFGRAAMPYWGEAAAKAYVQEARQEAHKLATALAELPTEPRIVVLHYAPIQATIEDEPRELWSFLGSSYLEEALTGTAVAAVFHGHAHYGTPAGHTASGVPVYNVALPLLRERFPARPPFHVLEISVNHET
jgi:Icc-related predicted phosphoesterase